MLFVMDKTDVQKSPSKLWVMQSRNQILIQSHTALSTWYLYEVLLFALFKASQAQKNHFLLLEGCVTFYILSITVCLVEIIYVYIYLYC